MSDHMLTFPNMRPLGPTFTQENGSYENIRRQFSKSGFSVLKRTSPKLELLPDETQNLKDVAEDQEGFVYIDDQIIHTLHLDFEKPEQVLFDVVVISNHTPPTVITIVEDTADVDTTVIRYNKKLTGRLILSLLHFTGENMTTLCTTEKKSNLRNKGVLKAHLDQAKKLGAETRTSDEMYMNDKKRNAAKQAIIGVLAFSNDIYRLYKTYEEEKEVLSLSYEDFAKRFQDVSNAWTRVPRSSSTKVMIPQPRLSPETASLGMSELRPSVFGLLQYPRLALNTRQTPLMQHC